MFVDGEHQRWMDLAQAVGDTITVNLVDASYLSGKQWGTNAARRIYAHLPLSWAEIPPVTVQVPVSAVLTQGSWSPESLQRCDESLSGSLRANEASVLTLLHLYFGQMTSPFSIIDVGANLGSYCLLPQGLPNSRSYCFEVNPTAVDLLERSIKLNNLESRATVFTAAVGCVTQ